MWVLFDEGKFVGLYHIYVEARREQMSLPSFAEQPLSSTISEVGTLQELKEHLDYFSTTRAFADERGHTL